MGLKISFGEGGFKGFLAQHAEKAVFGVVLALVAFFIYSSATQEGYDAANGPDDLKREAASADKHIKDDFWREIAPERENKVQPYPTIVDRGRLPINEGKYTPEYAWNKEDIPSKSERSDPELFAPSEVEVTGAVYSLAMRNSSTVTDDPWAGIEPAVEKPKEEPKKKKRKKPRRSTGYGGEYGGYGEEMGGYGEESYAEEDYMADESSGDEEYGDAYGYSSTGAGAIRQLGQFWKKHYIRGAQASSGGGRVSAKGYGLVAVKALVPFEKQWDEYDSVLASAAGYVPTKDIPNYIFFQAERADVTDDPDAPVDSLDWKPVSDTNVGMRSSAVYGSMAKEVADPTYLLPGVLTMPIPPVLLRSYDDLALHSEIPRMQMRPTTVERPEEETPDLESLTPGAGLEEGLPAVRRPGTSPYGGYGEESYGGYGEESYGGYGEESYGEDSYGEESYGEDSYGEEGYGYGEDSYGYGGGYGTGAPRLRPNSTYKLIRFFDFSAQPGRSYRYRVKAVLEDPNRPQSPTADPNKRILSKEVVERLANVEADDAAYTKSTGKPRRTYYRTTDWSEPSDVISLTAPEAFVAGAVTRGRVVTLPDGAEVAQSESTGKLVTVVWDKRKAIEVPVETDVYLGSYLDMQADADVLHPLTMQIMRLEAYDFKTGAVVADIRGGEPLIKDEIVEETEDEKKKPETTVNEYQTPGEIVVVDAKGNLIVCNELDDTEEYRRLLFIEDKPPAPDTSSYDSGYGEEESYGEEEYGYGDMYDGGEY